MHVASSFCPTCKRVVESFLVELGCCHYQLTPSTPTPSVPGTIFMHNTSIICSLVGGEIITLSHLSEFKPHLSHILCWIPYPWFDKREGNQWEDFRLLLSARTPNQILCLYAFESLTGHSQSWWKSMQVWCTLAAIPADTRQRIRALLCLLILVFCSAKPLLYLQAGWALVNIWVIFNCAALHLHQQGWEEHRCFILEDRSSKSNVHVTNLILKSLRKALKTKAQIPE